jgi:hypothetical protein
MNEGVFTYDFRFKGKRYKKSTGMKNKSAPSPDRSKEEAGISRGAHRYSDIRTALFIQVRSIKGSLGEAGKIQPVPKFPTLNSALYVSH